VTDSPCSPSFKRAATLPDADFIKFTEIPVPHAVRAQHVHLKILFDTQTSTSVVHPDSISLVGVSLPASEWRTLRQRQKKASRASSSALQPGYFYEYEHGLREETLSRSRLIPRQLSSVGRELWLQPVRKTFIHEADDDKCGVLYWLGCGGVQPWGTWRNPYTAEAVGISTSHNLFRSSMKTESIVDRLSSESSPTDCYWGERAGSKNSWLVVDLKQYRLRLSRLTLRHGYVRSRSSIKELLLEGSNDGAQWVSISTPGRQKATRGFGLQSWETANVRPRQYFQYFRIRRGRTLMCISGLELYGTLASSWLADQDL
jgi:hypothetical protein